MFSSYEISLAGHTGDCKGMFDYIQCLKLNSRLMVFKTIYNNISVISCLSVLLLEETGVPRKDHKPAASPDKLTWHKDVSSTPHHEQDLNSWL